MRIVILGAVLSMFGVAAPSAQTPAAPPVAAPPLPLGPPKGLTGYSQPEITAAYCRNNSPTQTTCTFPAMTAGRYIATATGTSTATGPGAAQALLIQVGSLSCGRADRKPSADWASGPKTIALKCDVVVMADKPLSVTVFYADDKATKDPKGPTLVLQRAPWEGVLNLVPYQAGQ